MNKLLLHCLLLLAFGLLYSEYSSAQVPRLGEVKTIVVTDDNFEPQKRTDRGPMRRGRLLYEVWIATDGLLHCKTSRLLSASVKTTNANGEVTTVGGDKGRDLSVHNQGFGNTHYTFDIKPDKYREMHSITLTIWSGMHGSAEIKLINKKVPAKIVN